MVVFFQFPLGIDVKTLWYLWYFGNNALRVGPYKRLHEKHRDDLRTKMERLYICKANKLMKEMENIAVQRGHSISDLRVTSADTRNMIYDDVYSSLMESLYGPHYCRGEDKQYITVANKLYKNEVTLKRRRDVADMDDYYDSD